MSTGLRPPSLPLRLVFIPLVTFNALLIVVYLTADLIADAVAAGLLYIASVWFAFLVFTAVYVARSIPVQRFGHGLAVATLVG